MHMLVKLHEVLLSYSNKKDWINLCRYTNPLQWIWKSNVTFSGAELIDRETNTNADTNTKTDEDSCGKATMSKRTLKFASLWSLSFLLSMPSSPSTAQWWRCWLRWTSEHLSLVLGFGCWWTRGGSSEFLSPMQECLWASAEQTSKSAFSSR